MNDEMKRSYNVDLTVEQTHHYVVDDVNSPEEAEEVAEQWLAEGELGEVTNQDIFGIDTYPVDDEEEEELT